MSLDSDPTWSPIKDNDLRYAVNTNWDLFPHDADDTSTFETTRRWIKASDVTGTWTPARTLPDSFSKLPAEDNWKDVKASLRPKRQGPAVPKVRVSTQPAELILSPGRPITRR